jgi:carbamoyltransferase
MGGVALNCVANTRIAAAGLFDNIWILPNPGDAGSSVGAAAAVLGGKIEWRGPYLGTPLGGEWPVDDILAALTSDGVVGVASGRAEFGPRALGNRSLLADPRPADMKDRVNTIKGREPFRPFAPIIRKERAHELFDLPVAESPYMQFTARCRLPEVMPAVAHFDGSSRVQTVTSEQHPGLYALLGAWEEKTGCAALLNTSLNGRGEPLLNDAADVTSWIAKTGIRVLS